MSTVYSVSSFVDLEVFFLCRVPRWSVGCLRLMQWLHAGALNSVGYLAEGYVLLDITLGSGEFTRN